MVPSSDPPTITTLPFKPLSLKMPNSDPKQLYDLPLTGSICLDVAHPGAFTDLSSRPALILAPARTWHPSVGVAMWEQARARAEEIGSQVLWCDGGEGGVSGVAGGGLAEFMQVGTMSWVRTIGVQWPFGEQRTVYGWGGVGLAFSLVLVPLGAGWLLDAICSGSKLGEGAPYSMGRLVRYVYRLKNVVTRGRQEQRVSEGESRPLLG
jgi:hypothetical protein